MDISAIEGKVRERFEAGFNCAESVFLVVTEAFGHHAPEQARLATAFGGGVGRCKEEMCGAVAGGVLAVGALHGRDRAGADWDTAAEVARAVRNDALATCGSTRCADLLDAFGEQQGMAACIRFTATVAGRVAARLLEAEGEATACDGPGSCACGCSASRLPETPRRQE